MCAHGRARIDQCQYVRVDMCVSICACRYMWAQTCGSIGVGRIPVATTQRSRIEVFDGTCCTPLSSDLSEEQAVDLARVFAALADPVRLRLLSIVASRDEVC